MSRHSSLPAITLAVCLLVPTTFFAQSVNQTASPIDVLYFVTNSTIQTYDVDPSSGSAALYGTLTVPGPSNSSPVFVPGTNDRYIYVLCTCGTTGTIVLVYAADSHGAPQNPPVQTVEFDTVFRNFVINPNGTLAYAGQALQNSQQPGAGIRGFALSPNTGILTPFPKLTAITYPPADGICGPDNPFGQPGFSLAGFNLDGTQLVDDWSCSGYDDWVGYYYTRHVDQETGALGPDVPTVGTGGSEDEFSTVTFTPTSILSFANYGFENSPNELYVYWPNATLDFSCTETMLDACSDSNAIAADRTGKFIFFYTYTGGTEVTKLNVNNKKIEPVGIPLADTINTFSLDDQIIYGSRTLSWNGQYVIPVYGFDPSTGLITNFGQTITMPNEYSILIPALRY
jgi:hypothetical protein